MTAIKTTPLILDLFSDWPPTASAVMEVDVGAIRRNYHTLKSHLKAASMSAVLKADAYGFGLIPVAKALYEEGCRHFFVAHVAEGIQLRPHVGESAIYVLSGAFPGTEELFIQQNLTPVLNDIAAIKSWGHRPHPSVLHVDTGMLRCGLSVQDCLELIHAGHIPQHTTLIMSHLACSPSKTHQKNEAQRTAFDGLRSELPHLKTSLADTGGLYLGEDFHYDLVRPGKGLFGLFDAPSGIALESCVNLKARVIQCRRAKAGETVGYGANTHLDHDAHLATIALGFADGLDRRMVGQKCIFMDGIPVPIVGSLSMDYTVVDISHVPAASQMPYVELLGTHQSFEDMAAAAGTISRELSIRLGTRLHRIYK